MFSETQNGKAILERVIEAYGVTTKKELAEKLETSPSSVSSWALRDAVPGDIIIKCAMETHRSLHWLMTGKEEFEKSNYDGIEKQPTFKSKDLAELKGQALYEQVLSSGGKAILERILQAYGFTKQKELADLLGISTATISTWIRREYFPGDVVVTCALDTGVELEWLSFGVNLSKTSGVISIPHKEIIMGKLYERPVFSIDTEHFSNIEQKKIILISKDNQSWIVSLNTGNISNGTWLVSVNGAVDIYKLQVKPKGTLVLISESQYVFECDVKDIELMGVVLVEINKLK